MKTPIKEVEWGLACCVRDGDKKWIEVNKHLKKYPKLYKSVMALEMKHFQAKNKHMDFWIDFKSFNIKEDWEIFKFSVKHPKAFYDLSPFFYCNKKLGVNWFCLLCYLTSFLFTFLATFGTLYLIR